MFRIDLGTYLDFAQCFVLLPVEDGKVPTLAPEHKVPPAAGEVDGVWPELRQRELHRLPSGADLDDLRDVLLLEPPCLLHALRLEGAPLRREQPKVRFRRILGRLPHEPGVPIHA